MSTYTSRSRSSRTRARALRAADERHDGAGQEEPLVRAAGQRAADDRAVAVGGGVGLAELHPADRLIAREHCGAASRCAAFSAASVSAREVASDSGVASGVLADVTADVGGGVTTALRTG